jgi:hypothetical protein
MASPSRKSHRSLPSDPLELAESALEELREADDWEEPTKPQIMINLPAAAVPPPAERRPSPAPVSTLASSAPPATPTAVVVTIWRRFPPWGGVLVAVVLIVAYTVLRLAGLRAPAGLP